MGLDAISCSHVAQVSSPLKVSWVANKRFVISKFNLKFPRARNLEIIGLVLGCIEASKQASQILQVYITRWKALAEIYTMHLSRIPRCKGMEEKKKMERQDEKGRQAMAENNYGDNNKIEAQPTALLCTDL